MNNDFNALIKSWQTQDIQNDLTPSTNDLAMAKQRQKKQKLLMYGEWLGIIVMFVTAAWLLITIPDWLSYISAGFLVFGGLSGIYASWQMHLPLLAYKDWSSKGILQFRYRACRLTLQHYSYTQLSCFSLILFTTVLWALRWWQASESLANALLFYSVFVSPLCLLAIYQLQQKKKLKMIELVQLKELNREFQIEE